jgi:ATP-dependent DNA helicase RecG
VSESTQGEVQAPSAAPSLVVSPKSANALHRVERTLRYALSQDGMVAWQLSWLERTLVPLLTEVVDALPAHPGVAHIAAAAGALKGVDQMAWMDRVPCAQAAIVCVQAARASGLEPTSELGHGELIVVPDIPEHLGQAVDASKVAKPAATKAEQVQRHALGAPQGTGRALTTIGELDPALIERFSQAGIEQISDLLTLVPCTHETLTPRSSEAELEEGASVALQGRIVAKWVRFSGTVRREEISFQVGERLVRCSWLSGMPKLNVGRTVCLVGELELDEDEALLFEALPWEPDSRGLVRRPRYEVDGLPDEDIWPLIRLALEQYKGQILDPLPPTLLQEYRIKGLEESFMDLHLPKLGLRAARTRPVFEELLLHQLAVASGDKTGLRGIAHPLNHEALALHQLESQLSLSDPQEMVFDEIRRDLRRPTAMTRLLQGDVGSGKALIALLAALLVGETKAQVCFIGPDDIAAEHRYLFAEPLLRAAGLVPQLVSGKPSMAQADAIRRGEAHAVFATHALFENFPEFKKLGLVIVEERAQFGVTNRKAICQKGVNPDLLVVTSVPIPLSLTFTVFSQHDLSVLREPMRQSVVTKVRGPTEREAAYATLREQLELGRQAYVVFPTRQGKDLVDLEQARQLTIALSTEAFPGANVALYHGAMGREDRFQVFEDFQRRRVDVLVCTTTIEDAPEVENATALMVDHADRYDLVRLHRLRGHVAQGRLPGTCEFVMTAQPSEEGQALVELVAQEQDGFAIAEKDRQQRGDAALLGGRQEELPDFQLADPTRDRPLLLKARRAALELLKLDPQLRQRNHRGLVRLLRERGMELEGEARPEANRGGAKAKGRRRRRRGRKK